MKTSLSLSWQFSSSFFFPVKSADDPEFKAFDHFNFHRETKQKKKKQIDFSTEYYKPSIISIVNEFDLWNNKDKLEFAKETDTD